MVQQAYGTAEPIYAAAAGANVETYLLADQGWNTYSTTIEARVDMVENNPDLVQRFIDASTVGWYNYLYGDNAAGNAAIISANPDQTLEKLAKEAMQLKSLGIIDSGNQLEVGIGAIDMAFPRIRKILSNGFCRSEIKKRTRSKESYRNCIGRPYRFR